MADFDPPFANSNGTKRMPNDAEIENGFGCGPADLDLFNGLFNALYRELGAVVLQAGDTPSNSSFRQVIDAMLKLFLRRQDGVVTLYVRTDGNDGNDGSANDAAHAFLTPQAAINYAASNFYTGNQAVEIVLGVAGSYAAPSVTSGSFLIRGLTASPSSYILGGSPGAAALVSVSSGSLRLQDLRLARGDNGNHVVTAVSGGALTLANIESTISVTSVFSHIAAGSGGTIAIAGPVSILSSSGSVLSSTAGSIQVFSTITVPGAAAFTDNTVKASVGGSINFGTGGAWAVSGGGNPTAQRYSVASNGVINTSGAGASFIPGTASGVSSTGGQYV